MSKATLEFSIPEELEEFRSALQGGKYYAMLQEVNELLYKQDGYSKAEHMKLAQNLRDILEELDTL
jgi:hypothetical protein